MTTFRQAASGIRQAAQDIRRQAMTRAVFVVEAEAKRQAPVKLGGLRRSLHGRVVSPERGIVGTNLPYARPVHDGSRPHIIRAKRAKALYWKGARHPVKSVNHPGNRANPFLRRAAERSRARVEAELRAVGITALARVK